ncbi:MAG: hypothetical protein ACR2J8_01765, partial [Thermomicrobiales bacterium]
GNVPPPPPRPAVPGPFTGPDANIRNAIFLEQNNARRRARQQANWEAQQQQSNTYQQIAQPVQRPPRQRGFFMRVLIGLMRFLLLMFLVIVAVAILQAIL